MNVVFLPSIPINVSMNAKKTKIMKNDIIKEKPKFMETFTTSL